MRSSTQEQHYLVNLREVLTNRFDEGELRTLCFDLRIEYDDLPGIGNSNKARELVAHCYRHNNIPSLVEVGRRQRPDIAWDELARIPSSMATESDATVVTATPTTALSKPQQPETPSPERTIAKPTPQEFESLVRELLEATGAGLYHFSTSHREVVPGLDGEYEIDVTARFRALGGDFLVLVECEHNTKSIKQEIVQVLADKVRSTGAQKGMLFTTSTFQVGAIEYAARHGIALIRLVAGRPEWLTRRGSQQTADSELAPGSYELWIIREPLSADPSQAAGTLNTVQDIREFLLGEVPYNGRGGYDA